MGCSPKVGSVDKHRLLLWQRGALGDKTIVRAVQDSSWVASILKTPGGDVKILACVDYHYDVSILVDYNVG